MVIFRFNHLVMTIMGALFHPVGGQLEIQNNRDLIISERFTNASYLQSMDFISYVEDREFMKGVLVIPAIISKNSHLQLQLVYDQDYDDVLVSLHHFPQALSGNTISVYDEAINNPGQILAPAAGKTMIALLCQPQHILQIFHLIKTQKLKSMEAIWLLVVRTVEDKEWLTKHLEGLILEGTMIFLLTRISLVLFKISVSRVDLDGITRLYDTTTMDITNISDPRRYYYLSRLLSIDNNDLYSDMKGRELRVTANNVLLFAELGPTSDDGKVLSHSGIEFSILDTLSEKLNFTYFVIKGINNEWGNILPNGKATGMIGMVYRREVDIALAHITITGSRSKGVDFTFPFILDSLAIMSRAPKVKNPTFIAFSPFTAKVWFCIFIITLAIGPYLKFLSLASETYLKERSLGNFQSLTFAIFRNIVVQGNSLQTQSFSHRTILYFWYIFCLIVSALYSGTLVAMLAIPSYEKPIDSLFDLPRAVKEGFIIGTRRRTHTEHIFRHAKEGVYRDTWLLFNHEDLSKSLVGKEGFSLVAKKKYAHITIKSVMEAEAIRRGRNLHHISRESFHMMWLGQVCAKGAPFKDLFDGLIMRMLQCGLIEKWKRDKYRSLKKANVTINNDSISQPIKLVHLQAAFYVLVLGSLVASSVLASEKVYFVLFRSKKTKRY